MHHQSPQQGSGLGHRCCTVYLKVTGVALCIGRVTGVALCIGRVTGVAWHTANEHRRRFRAQGRPHWETMQSASHQMCPSHPLQLHQLLSYIRPADQSSHSDQREITMTAKLLGGSGIPTAQKKEGREGSCPSHPRKQLRDNSPPLSGHQA
eukprot:349907-Chlamydomonas_euryale.AAC.14